MGGCHNCKGAEYGCPWEDDDRCDCDDKAVMERLIRNAEEWSRKNVIEEAEAKVKEYASIWMSYNDGMTKEQIAQEALNSAKEAMIQILEKLKEQKNE